MPACVKRALRKAKAAQHITESVGTSKTVVLVFGHRTESMRPAESPVVIKMLRSESDGAHLREIGIKTAGSFREIQELRELEVRYVERLPPGSDNEEDAKELSTILNGVSHIRLFLPREESSRSQWKSI